MTTSAVCPFAESARHTYWQIAAKVRAYYGIADAEQWFSARVKQIRDRCASDPYGIAGFPTLRSYWEDRQMTDKWNPDRDANHCVELYRVRAPGANGARLNVRVRCAGRGRYHRYIMNDRRRRHAVLLARRRLVREGLPIGASGPRCRPGMACMRRLSATLKRRSTRRGARPGRQ